MTRRVEEGNAAAVLQLHVVGTDVLGYATCLTGNDVGVANEVEQRGLTVVYVTHDRHYRRTADQIVLVVILLGDGVLHLSAYIFGSEPELVGHDVDGLSVQALVDGHHDADGHTGSDDLIHADVHHRSQLGDGHKLRQLQHFRLCCLSCHLLAQPLLHGVALLAAVLGTLLVLVLGGQTCQRFLYLTCHVLIVHL